MEKMYMGKIGFCIGEDIKRPESNSIFEQLKTFGTPALADGLNKFNVLDPEIKTSNPNQNIRIAGPAITVRVRPGDNLMLHKAIGLAKAGDIIIVDTCGCRNYALMGDLMGSSAIAKGIAGIVIDGGIRDIQDIREKKMPIWARFVSPAVGDKSGPGQINMPISCGGVPVIPGDYIVADDNGVVVIPPYLVSEIIQGTIKKLEYEKKRAVEIENGVYMKPEIDEQLRSLGIIE